MLSVTSVCFAGRASAPAARASSASDAATPIETSLFLCWLIIELLLSGRPFGLCVSEFCLSPELNTGSGHYALHSVPSQDARRRNGGGRLWRAWGSPYMVQR